MGNRKYQRCAIFGLGILLMIGCGSEKEEPKGVTVIEQEESSAEETAAEDSVMRETAAEESVLEIGEKMFLTQINDMYYNFDNYRDKTIIVEGMYSEFSSWDGTWTVPVVYRNGPGCCGNDGWGGFLLKYEGEFPEENDWIRVTGTPELAEDEAGYTNLYLKVISIEIMKERGNEFVTQ